MQFVNKEMNEEIAGVKRSFRMDNIVAVAACNRKGQLASFSNYSRHSVLLAASGVRIQSCTLSPNLFEYKNGTSQATPQVAATLAMMVNLFPGDTYSEIIDRLRRSVDPDATLELKTISGGCLNIGRALGMER
mmetsp:Transcript_17408/g.23887  ORF Transcript_17408/g.23887 Transcript_17408/m.23887 type:complete len:133 (+) Transcript_17408:730-1128(+)